MRAQHFQGDYAALQADCRSARYEWEWPRLQATILWAMDGFLTFAALCAVLGFFLPMMPGRVAAIISLVFMVFAVLVCGVGAYGFWAGSYYGDEGWDPLLFLPTVYFALVVVTLVGLFVTRHSNSSWRLGIGGVAMAALMGILPLLTIVVLFSGSS